MKINIKKLVSEAKPPTRGSSSAAGWDLHNLDKVIYLNPGETKKVGTGIALEIPEGFFGAIYARSGLATKNGLRPANCVGIIDSDYRGEIIVALHNDFDSVQTVAPGERIAQLVIQSFLDVEFNEVEELSDTSRGEGGFGSTGKN